MWQQRVKKLEFDVSSEIHNLEIVVERQNQEARNLKQEVEVNAYEAKKLERDLSRAQGDGLDAMVSNSLGTTISRVYACLKNLLINAFVRCRNLMKLLCSG